MYRSVLASGVAAVAVFAACGGALAQTVEPAPEQATEVGEIVVTGSQVELPPAYAGGQVASGGRVGLFGALDNMDAPFSVTSYTEEVVRNQQARSIADVLQNDPTVRVAKGFGNFQELYVVRGFPVYSDDMTYNGVYGVLPRQFVAAELVERVEVFHGANSFLNGAAPGGSGVGGAFNVVPKRAGDPLTRLTAGWETGGQLYGAADVARRFGPDQDLGVRLNLVRRDGETSVENQERELSVAALGVDYQGDRLRFSADAGYQDHRIEAPRPSVTPFGQVPEPPSADVNFAQPWTYTDEQQLFGAARGEFDVNDSISLWAAVGGRKGEERNVLANPNTDAQGVTSAYRFDNAREDEVISADAGVRIDVTTGPLEHRLIASASRVKLESKNAYAFSSFAGFAGDLYEPFPVAPPVPDFFVGGDLDDPLTTERTENTSFALADMVTALDGRLIATLGVRWQEIDVRTFDYNTGTRLTEVKDDALTPAVGLVFKPTDMISVYANYSEALQPGAIAPAQSGGLPIENAGEVLSTFRSEQYEVGVKVDTGNYGGTASLFSVTQPTSFVAPRGSGEDTLYFFTDNGEQENRGLEVSVYGEPVEGFRVIGGATFIEAELQKTTGGALDGNTAIGVPEVTFNLNLEYDLPMIAGLTVEGRLVYTGEQTVDAANTEELDSWTRIDLGARYTLPLGEREIELKARVENLADEDYWASVGGYPNANYMVLGSPRTFLLSASVDF